MLSVPKVRIVDSLEPSELPAGHCTRLMVNLVHDALGMATQVPMLVARGEKHGPIVGITAAVHGNEVNGISVIHELFDRLNLKMLRGTVAAAIVVNVPAYHAHSRFLAEGMDLNHMFPGDSEGNVAQTYAHRILQRIVSRFDVLVDLHTASTGRANSLYVRADLQDARTARMAMLQRPQIILHNPPSDYTLRGAASELGIPAITVEIGNPSRFQPEYIRRALSGVRAVMSDLGVIPKRKFSLALDPVICAQSAWMYTEQGGLLEVLPAVTDFVSAGQVVARQSNIFGDLTREYRAPHDGVVIGKSVDPVASTGARILHLGVVDASGAILKHYGEVL